MMSHMHTETWIISILVNCSTTVTISYCHLPPQFLGILISKTKGSNRFPDYIRH